MEVKGVGKDISNWQWRLKLEQGFFWETKSVGSSVSLLLLARPDYDFHSTSIFLIPMAW
jgi:hypothetical protein